MNTTVSNQHRPPTSASWPDLPIRLIVGDEFQLLRWVLRRLAFSILVLFLLSVLVFTATQLLPGDAVTRLGPLLPESVRHAVRIELGLDQPPVQRYFSWLSHVVRLDMGQSLKSHAPVWPAVSSALGNSLLLAGLAALVIIPFAVLVGSLAALYKGRWLDGFASSVTLIGLSVPEFVLGTTLVWIFAVLIPIFPALSIILPESTWSDRIDALVLPVLTLTPVTSAYMVKTMRLAMVRALSEDFVEYASFKGLSRRRIVLRHALPNALIPMINVFALNAAWLVGGIVVTETIFQYPGIGLLLVNAITSLDVPLIQGAALMLGATYVTLNLVADLAVAFIDPRIRARVIR